MSRYALGVDFGTLSARALVAEIGTGRELGAATVNYPHAVMDKALPDGTQLPPDWALQHPADYLACLREAIPAALKRAGVRAGDVIGVGIDCTACTLLAVDDALSPLCFQPEFAGHPHAYAKLWKHHATQAQADKITAVARERGEGFLARYGGRASPEWMLPKIMQLLDEAPEVYARARFIEAGDWLVYTLTGKEARSACMAGYKAFWSKREGYPSRAFFAALDKRLENLAEEKLGREIFPIGAKAGEITPEAAALTGLAPGTAVAVANVDAHVSLASAGIAEPGKLMMIMGTSTCHILLGEAEAPVEGMCGAVEDGAIPGYTAYEAGQSCVGDYFNWFVENCVPEAYARRARAEGLNLHELLTREASALRAGESGLVALDWWNGNRSVLVDANLTGALLGMTLHTRPEEIYRALIEATAYGTRAIVDTFEASGLPVRELYACGGIAHKNPFAMQVYADVMNREIRVARSTQAPALGSAMFGAVAAGAARGGYGSIVEAAREMGGTLGAAYRPIADNVAAYQRLYREYAILSDYFGRGANDVMKRLKALRRERRSGDGCQL